MSCVLFLFDMTEYRHAADSPYIQNTQKQKQTETENLQQYVTTKQKQM